MNKAMLLVLTVLMAPLGSLAHDYVPGAVQEKPILLKGGDLYTVANGVLANTDILFEDGRITQIGTELSVPEGTDIIDVSGKRVYPGLIAPYSLLGLVEIGAIRATLDYQEVGTINPEVKAEVAYNPDSEIIPTVRANGVTAALVAPRESGGNRGLISGRSSLLYLDGWTAEDAMVKSMVGLHVFWPRLSVSHSERFQRSVEKQRKANKDHRQSLQRAFEDARAYALATAADPTLPVDIRWEAMKPIFSRELPVIVDADDVRQIKDALAFAHQFGFRLILAGAKDAWQVANLLAEERVPVILGRTQSMPQREDDPYDLTYRLPSILHQAGVRFCLGYGSYTGTRNLPFQAGQAAAYGLSKEDALRAVTLSPAEILGVADQLGSLEIGKAATIVVSNGDLLDNRTNAVELEFIAGRKVDLDTKQKELYRKYRDRKVVR